MLVNRLILDDWAKNQHTFKFNVPVEEDVIFSDDDVQETFCFIEYNLGILDYYGDRDSEGDYLGYSTDTESKEEFDKIVSLIEKVFKEKGYL